MRRHYQSLTFFVLSGLSFGVFAQSSNTCTDANGSPVVQYVGTTATITITDKGVSKNDDFFPFGEEAIVTKTPELNSHYVARAELHYRVLTRFAFREGNKIVFIETTRSRRKGLKDYIGNFISRDLKYYSKPEAFDQNVLTFEKNDHMTAAFVHMQQKQRAPDYPGEKVPMVPRMSMDDIKDPELFQRKEMKDVFAHLLEGQLDYGYVYADQMLRKDCKTY